MSNVTLALIIISSILVGLAIVTALLYLFTKKVLKNNNHNISITILVLLIVQFILGMLNNLYVTIPKAKSYNVYHYLGPVSIHTANALFLLIFSIFYVINAHKLKNNQRLGEIGVFSIVVATIGGLIFVNSGGQNDVYSLVMALGFISAFLIYAYTTFAGSFPKTPRKTHTKQ